MPCRGKAAVVKRRIECQTGTGPPQICQTLLTGASGWFEPLQQRHWLEVFFRGEKVVEGRRALEGAL